MRSGFVEIGWKRLGAGFFVNNRQKLLTPSLHYKFVKCLMVSEQSDEQFLPEGISSLS
jgi:hypothetical protein